jgi:hypothetical protein
MNPIIVYQLNSGFIPLTGLQDLSFNPPIYVNNASVINATLFSPASLVVLGPITGIYQSGTNGNYNFPIPNTFNSPVGSGYTLVVNVTAPSGAVAQWSIPAAVATRGAAAYSN